MKKSLQNKGLSTEKVSQLMEEIVKCLEDKIEDKKMNIEDKGKTTIYLVRRSETLLDSIDKTQGITDSPLTSEGIKIAKNLAKGLQDIRFLSIFVNNESCIETSKIIMKYNKNSGYIPFQKLKSLNEWCFGNFEGDKNYVMGTAIMENAKISSQEEFSELGISKIADIISEEDPSGKAENWNKIEKRLKKALNEIKENSFDKGGNILVVSHALTIASIIYLMDNSQDVGMDIMNGSVSKVLYKNNQFKMLEINNMDYVYKSGYLKPFSYE